MTIVITIYALILCLPAAIITWNTFEEGCFGGCGMLIIQILGLPGTILIVLMRLIMYFLNLPHEIKQKNEQGEDERRNAEAQEKQKQENETRQKAYQEALNKKREKVYPNSPVTQEIVQLITQGNEYPYSIEINRTGLTFNYENKTSAYVLRAHGLPDFDTNEERIFAEVLNQKLGYKYSVRPNEKIHTYSQGDGTTGYCLTYVSTIMELKITRSF